MSWYNMNLFRNKAYIDAENIPRNRVLELARQNIAQQTTIKEISSSISIEDKFNIDKFIQALVQSIDNTLILIQTSLGNPLLKTESSKIADISSKILIAYNQLMYYVDNVAKSSKNNVKNYVNGIISGEVLFNIKKIADEDVYGELDIFNQMIANIETQYFKPISITIARKQSSKDTMGQIEPQYQNLQDSLDSIKRNIELLKMAKKNKDYDTLQQKKKIDVDLKASQLTKTAIEKALQELEGEEEGEEPSLYDRYLQEQAKEPEELTPYNESQLYGVDYNPEIERQLRYYTDPSYVSGYDPSYKSGYDIDEPQEMPRMAGLQLEEEEVIDKSKRRLIPLIKKPIVFKEPSQGQYRPSGLARYEGFEGIGEPEEIFKSPKKQAPRKIEPEVELSIRDEIKQMRKDIAREQGKSNPSKARISQKDLDELARRKRG